MQSVRRTSWLRTALLLLIVLPGPARAAYTVFDYRVDRFEASGQVNFIDEFNDSALSPWSVGVGTAVDTGVDLSLRSPGVFMPNFWTFVAGFPGMSQSRLIF